jgi:hypothetical protein
LTNPDLRNALHPVVTASAFHRTGAAADRDEYPWLYEFGIPVDNYASMEGLFDDLQKRLGLRERREQVPIPAGAFVVTSKNNSKALMISIPTSKSKTGEDKLVATVQKGIAWEDVLTPLGVESSSYHGGALNVNAIRRLMEHAGGIEIGIKQHLDGCCIAGRETESKS